MNYMNKIFEKLNTFPDFNETNIIERIKAVLKKEDPDKYKEWEEDNFNPNHMFSLENDYYTGTLLYFACQYNDERTVKLLINTKTVDVNAQGGHQGISPLMIAADGSSQSIVKTLLNAGADPNVTNHVDDSVIYERDQDQRTRIHADFIIQLTLLLNPKEKEINDLQPAGKTQYWNDCKAVAQTMQSDDLLLREFLLEIDETKLADHLSNSDMREKLATGQYKEQYPPYSDMIKSQYEQAIIQNQLNNPSVEQAQTSHKFPS